MKNPDSFDDNPMDDGNQFFDAFGNPTDETVSLPEFLRERALADRDPNGSPFATVEQKWQNDIRFSEVTADIPDIDAEPNTTIGFRVIEVGTRILDSRFGEVAATVVFGGMAAASKLRRKLSRETEFGHENPTTPLTTSQHAEPRELAQHVQRARYLQVNTPSSESVTDLDELRGRTLASSLLRDAQEVVRTTKTPISFDEALDAAAAARHATADVFQAHVIDIATQVARDRFAEVELETALNQAA
jgi:hypothetical protein